MLKDWWQLIYIRWQIQHKYITNKTKINSGDIMQLADVTTIKNRLGEIIQHEKDEIVTLEDLIIFCESAGANSTASTLKNLLQHEKNETINLRDLEKRYENEENRLTSISPELRYPLVSERYGHRGVREGIGQEYRGFMVRNTGDRYRGYKVREPGVRESRVAPVAPAHLRESRGLYAREPRGGAYMVRDHRSRY